MWAILGIEIDMKIGIVGSEAAKFTSDTQEKARETIRSIIADAELVISGHCHLGGIDIWAIEEAKKLGIPTVEYPPAILQWSGGYRERNLQIARASDIVVCITIKEFPADYTGKRFVYCYHCKTDTHIKSGGCWTVKKAELIGKETFVLAV